MKDDETNIQQIEGTLLISHSFKELEAKFRPSSMPMLFKAPVCSHPGCCNIAYHRHWVSCKEQKFIFHNSEAWKSKPRAGGTADSCLVRTTSQTAVCYFHAVWVMDLSGISSPEALIPFAFWRPCLCAAQSTHSWRLSPSVSWSSSRSQAERPCAGF